MKKRDLAYMACRVLGIYVFILALKELCAYLGLTLGPMLTHTVDKHELIKMWAAFLTPFIALVAFAIILWICAGELSVRIAPRDSEEETGAAGPVGIRDIRAIALSVAGAIVLTSVIPQLFQLLPQITVILVNKVPIDANMQLGIITDSIQKLVTFIIGLYLFLWCGKGKAAVKKPMEPAAPKTVEDETTLDA